MTTKGKVFRICLLLQYLSFFGLILVGLWENDAFDSRLLLPITLLGVACGINTFALLQTPTEPGKRRLFSSGVSGVWTPTLNQRRRVGDRRVNLNDRRGTSREGSDRRQAKE